MKNIKLVMHVMIHDINVKQAELFSLHKKIDNMMQIYASMNNDFDSELNSELCFQNEEYLKFLAKRRAHILDSINELKEREKTLSDVIEASFHEKEKLKIFLKSKKHNV